MEKPDEQENTVHYLHFAEVVAALRILDMGGCLVLKMFTMFELTTVSLLYFLNNVFDKVDIFKPAASKQGNSEVYVICIGYQRTFKNITYLLKMTDHIKHNVLPMFTVDDIPNDFIGQIFDCAKLFMLYQTKAIESNVFHFRCSNKGDREYIHDLRCAISKEYIKLYRLKPIRDEMKILQGESCSDLQNMNVPVYTYSGSYKTRLVFKNLTKYEKQLELRLQWHDIEKKIAFHCRVENSPLVTHQQYTETLKIFRGKPIRHIVSSKFVLIQCLKLLLGIIHNSMDVTKDSSDVSIDSDLSSDYPIITIDIVKFKNIKNFDRFEKALFTKLINAIISIQSNDNIRIINLLLLTHFSVGFIYALGCVFEEILLTSNGEIHLNGLRSNGKQFLTNILMNHMDLTNAYSKRSVLGVVQVKYLRNNSFYNSVFTYNNKLSMKYCKTLLEC